MNALETAAWPTLTIELDASEQLIVWALRRWVGGLRQNDGTQWTLVWREFGRQFSQQDGTRALAGFARLIDGIQRHARRVMRLHQACCPCLSADEVCLVGLIAACQCPAPATAKARAEWMVHADGVGPMLEAGTQFASIMQRHGMTLPWRTETDIDGRGEAGLERALQTVH